MVTNRDWHLDKRVSIFLLIGMGASIVMNIVSIVWFAAKLDQRVEILEERPDLEARVIKLEALTGEHGRILQRLDSTIDRMSSVVDYVAKEQAKRTPAINRVYEHEKEHRRSSGK